MKIAGIIAEYNPFHTGHMYHMQQTRQKLGVNYIISVISGNFTQRGDIAVTDKWLRTKMALECGADLVLELPFLYAVQSAKFFALGGIKILDSLKCVDYLSFGSENENIEDLNKIASFLKSETDIFKSTLQSYINKGSNYKIAYETTLCDLLSIPKTIFSPNNILALEYLKAINEIKSNMKPKNILRKGGGFSDENLLFNFSSASAIRKSMLNTGLTAEILNNIPLQIHKLYDFSPIFNQDLFSLLLYKIRLMSTEQLNKIYDICEGLEYKIKESAKTACNYNELIDGIKSKRYTYTKIKRIMLYILFDVNKEIFANINSYPLYARVLGFRKDSQQIFSEIRGDVPIITKSNEFIKSTLLDYDILASDIYGVVSHASASKDYTHKLIIL